MSRSKRLANVVVAYLQEDDVSEELKDTLENVKKTKDERSSEVKDKNKQIRELTSNMKDIRNKVYHPYMHYVFTP